MAAVNLAPTHAGGGGGVPVAGREEQVRWPRVTRRRVDVLRVLYILYLGR